MQLLSLTYHKIIYKADKEDYLRNSNKLEKNAFHHSAYNVKMKKSIDHPALLQSLWLADVTSKFDDNGEIQQEEINT